MTNAHEFLEWFQNATEKLDDDVTRDVLDAELFDVADAAIDARGVIQTAIDRARSDFNDGDELDDDDMRQFIQDVVNEVVEVGASPNEVASVQSRHGGTEEAKKNIDLYAQAETDTDNLNGYLEPFSSPIAALTEGMANYAESVALEYFSTFVRHLESLVDDLP